MCAAYRQWQLLLEKQWFRGVVLYTGSEVIPFGANLHAVPISRFGRSRLRHLTEGIRNVLKHHIAALGAVGDAGLCVNVFRRRAAKIKGNRVQSI